MYDGNTNKVFDSLQAMLYDILLFLGAVLVFLSEYDDGMRHSTYDSDEHLCSFLNAQENHDKNRKITSYEYHFPKLHEKHHQRCRYGEVLWNGRSHSYTIF